MSTETSLLDTSANGATTEAPAIAGNLLDPPQAAAAVVPPSGEPAAVVPPVETTPVVDPAKPVEPQKVVPEKYEAFKFSEGQTLDEAKATEFGALAKSLNLSQSEAQQLVDLQSKFVSDNQAAINSEYERTTAQWKADSIKDLGPNYQEKLATASKALERFGTPELRQFLNDTRIGNNPQMIKMLMKVGEAISEDKFIEGKAGGGTEKSTADILYPNSK